MVAAFRDAQVGGVAGGQAVAVPLRAESNSGIPHLSWAGQRRAGEADCLDWLWLRQGLATV